MSAICRPAVGKARAYDSGTGTRPGARGMGLVLVAGVAMVVAAETRLAARGVGIAPDTVRARGTGLVLVAGVEMVLALRGVGFELGTVRARGMRFGLEAAVEMVVAAELRLTARGVGIELDGIAGAGSDTLFAVVGGSTSGEGWRAGDRLCVLELGDALRTVERRLLKSWEIGFWDGYGFLKFSKFC